MEMMIKTIVIQPGGKEGGDQNAGEGCDQGAVQLQLGHLHEKKTTFLTCVCYILSNVHLGLNFIPFRLVAVQIGAD